MLTFHGHMDSRFRVNDRFDVVALQSIDYVCQRLRAITIRCTSLVPS